MMGGGGGIGGCANRKADREKKSSKEKIGR